MPQQQDRFITKLTEIWQHFWRQSRVKVKFPHCGKITGNVEMTKKYLTRIHSKAFMSPYAKFEQHQNFGEMGLAVLSQQHLLVSVREQTILQS